MFWAGSGPQGSLWAGSGPGGGRGSVCDGVSGSRAGSNRRSKTALSPCLLPAAMPKWDLVALDSVAGPSADFPGPPGIPQAGSESYMGCLYDAVG